MSVRKEFSHHINNDMLSNIFTFHFNKQLAVLVRFIKHLRLPGHPFVLHFGDTVEGPGHVFPPLAGLGFVQDLDLDFVPPPHVAVQDDQPLQAVQAPCTDS